MSSTIIIVIFFYAMLLSFILLGVFVGWGGVEMMIKTFMAIGSVILMVMVHVLIDIV